MTRWWYVSFASVCSEGELNSFNIYDIDDLI